MQHFLSCMLDKYIALIQSFDNSKVLLVPLEQIYFIKAYQVLVKSIYTLDISTLMLPTSSSMIIERNHLIYSLSCVIFRITIYLYSYLFHILVYVYIQVPCRSVGVIFIGMAYTREGVDTTCLNALQQILHLCSLDTPTPLVLTTRQHNVYYGQ